MSSATESPSFLRRLSGWTTSPWFWGVLLAFGIAARARQYFFNPSYWALRRGVHVVLTIRDSGFAGLLGPLVSKHVIPPVYLWVLRALYDIGGQGELLMRLPAFLAGIAALFMMVPLARLVAGPKHGVWALAFLAVCRHALDHGTEAHPYMSDLLFVELILYFAALVVMRTGAQSGGRGGQFALISLALLVRWTSFPSVFVLAAASAALALRQWRDPVARGWTWWVAFNGAAAVSGLSEWWFSSRFMYYPGIVDVWGAKGWGGFPDWGSFPKICGWILSRPVEVGNYGNRELGIVLTLLAIIGVVRLARRPALLVLLLGPFALAVAAALAGKYPVADRTCFFLLPCLWLVAALGIAGIVEWGARKQLELAGIPVLLIAWDFFWLLAELARPDARMDFRGAYQYINAHRQPGDAIWSITPVVYEAYYGTDPAVIDFRVGIQQAIDMNAGHRLWLLTNVPETRLQMPGRDITVRRPVHGIGELLLLEPKKEPANSPGRRALILAEKNPSANLCADVPLPTTQPQSADLDMRDLLGCCCGALFFRIPAAAQWRVLHGGRVVATWQKSSPRSPDHLCRDRRQFGQSEQRGSCCRGSFSSFEK